MVGLGVKEGKLRSRGKNVMAGLKKRGYDVLVQEKKKKKKRNGIRKNKEKP